MSIISLFKTKKKTEKVEAQVGSKDTIKNISEFYQQQQNAFLESFDAEKAAFEENAKKRLSDLQTEINTEYYTETNIKLGGIDCAIKDEEAIAEHYAKLKEEQIKLHELIQEKRKSASECFKQFTEDATEAMQLEQKLYIQELAYEAILPTQFLNDLIYPLPLYVFKYMNKDGYIKGHINDDDDEKLLEKHLKDPKNYEKHIIAKRVFFGKRHLTKQRQNLSNYSKREFSAKIIFPEAERSVQDKIVAFHQKGYVPYTIAHEEAFHVSEVHIMPKEGCPISVVDKGNMSILIVQYGPFDMEKVLIEEAKKWFANIHEKCFSLN